MTSIAVIQHFCQEGLLLVLTQSSADKFDYWPTVLEQKYYLYWIVNRRLKYHSRSAAGWRGTRDTQRHSVDSRVYGHVPLASRCSLGIVGTKSGVKLTTLIYIELVLIQKANLWTSKLSRSIVGLWVRTSTEQTGSAELIGLMSDAKKDAVDCFVFLSLLHWVAAQVRRLISQTVSL